MPFVHGGVAHDIKINGLFEQTAYKMKLRACERLAIWFHHPPLTVVWVSEGTKQRRPCRLDFIKACQIAPVRDHRTPSTLFLPPASLFHGVEALYPNGGLNEDGGQNK